MMILYIEIHIYIVFRAHTHHLVRQNCSYIEDQPP
jgi:hypothetical protein